MVSRSSMVDEFPRRLSPRFAHLNVPRLQETSPDPTRPQFLCDAHGTDVSWSFAVMQIASLGLEGVGIARLVHGEFLLHHKSKEGTTVTECDDAAQMLAEEQLTVVCEQGPFLDLQRDARRLQLNAVSSLLLLRASFFLPVFYPSSARPV